MPASEPCNCPSCSAARGDTTSNAAPQFDRGATRLVPPQTAATPSERFWRARREEINAFFSEWNPQWTAGGSYCRLQFPSSSQHDVRVHARQRGCTIVFRTDHAAELPGARRSPNGSYRIATRNFGSPRAQRIRHFLRDLEYEPVTNSSAPSPRHLRLERRWGVELEFNLSGRDGRQRVRNALEAAGISLAGDYDRQLDGQWSVKGDGSLGPNGIEVCTPPMRGEDGFEELRKGLRVLRELGATVDRRCGLHVHHEATDLGVAGIKKAARMWFTHQDIINWLVPSGRWGNEYARDLSASDMRYIEDSTSGQFRCDRYRSFNVTSYGRHGTVEVRLHGGTLDATKIEAWIRFGQGLIGAATAARSDPTERSVSLGLLFQRIGLDSDTTTFLLGRALRFSAPAEAVGLTEVTS